jgi:hypothetical protein
VLHKVGRVAQAQGASIKHKGVKTVHLAASVVPPLQLLQAPLNQGSVPLRGVKPEARMP